MSGRSSRQLRRQTKLERVSSCLLRIEYRVDKARGLPGMFLFSGFVRQQSMRFDIPALCAHWASIRCGLAFA